MNEQDIETPERYGGEPLYDRFPSDYSERDRTFTVAIAGPERHDGEKPNMYVLEARSTQAAWAEALAWHIAAEETPDCYVAAGESFEGVPAGDVGFQWNDLRPEQQGRRDSDRLAPVPLDRILHRVRLIWPDAGWVLREPPKGKPSLTWQGGPGVEEVAQELRLPDIVMTRTRPARALGVAVPRPEYRDDDELVADFRAALLDWCAQRPWPRLAAATFPATRSTDPEADFWLRAEGAVLSFDDGSSVVLEGHEFGSDAVADALNCLNADGPEYDTGLTLLFSHEAGPEAPSSFAKHAPPGR